MNIYAVDFVFSWRIKRGHLTFRLNDGANHTIENTKIRTAGMATLLTSVRSCIVNFLSGVGSQNEAAAAAIAVELSLAVGC